MGQFLFFIPKTLLDIYEFWKAQSNSVEKRSTEEKKPCIEALEGEVVGLEKNQGLNLC